MRNGIRSNTIWRMATTNITIHEYDALQLEAIKRGVSVNALLYELLKTATKEFTDWSCVPEMPRGRAKRQK